MRRNLKIAVLGLTLLTIAIPATAQFYQYVDGKGITHFTDNISTIPPQYQSQIERRQANLMPRKKNSHSNTDNPVTKAPDACFETNDLASDDTALGDDADFADDVLPAPESLKSATPSEIAKLVEERKVLQDKKQVLDTKFERLLTEKLALEKSRDDMKDQDDIKRYNARVKDINRKIKQYKKEEQHFKAEIGRYNNLIEPLISKSE